MRRRIVDDGYVLGEAPFCRGRLIEQFVGAFARRSERILLRRGELPRSKFGDRSAGHKPGVLALPAGAVQGEFRKLEHVNVRAVFLHREAEPAERHNTLDLQCSLLNDRGTGIRVGAEQDLCAGAGFDEAPHPAHVARKKCRKSDRCRDRQIHVIHHDRPIPHQCANSLRNPIEHERSAFQHRNHARVTHNVRRMNGCHGETNGRHPRIPTGRRTETALHIEIHPRLPVIAALQAPRRGVSLFGIIAGRPVVMRDRLGRREIDAQPDTRLVLRAARRFAAEIQPLAPHRRVWRHDAVDRLVRHFSRRERTDVFIRADAAGRVVGDADPIRRDIHPFVEKRDLGKLHGIGCARIFDPLDLEPVEGEAVGGRDRDRAIRNRQVCRRRLRGLQRQRAGPVFFERDRPAEPRALPRVVGAVRQHAQRRGAIGAQHTSRADQPVHDVALAVEIQHRVRRKADMSRARSVRQPVVLTQTQNARRDLGVADIAELVGRQGQAAVPQFPQPALAGENQRAGRIRNRHIISLRIQIDRPPGLGQHAQCAERLFCLDEFGVVLARTQDTPLENHFCDGVVIFIDGRHFDGSLLLQRQHARLHRGDAAARRPPRIEPELVAAQQRVADGDAGLRTQGRVVIGIAGDTQVAVDDELPAGDQQRAGSAVRAHI